MVKENKGLRGKGKKGRATTTTMKYLRLCFIRLPSWD